MIERLASHRILVAGLLAACLAAGPAAAAEFANRPLAADQGAAPLAAVARHQAAALDVGALAAEDMDREAAGLPYRFAGAERVELTPANSGTWERLATGEELWRLRVGSPGALSLNLGFTRCWLPAGARLAISAADGSSRALVFDERDNRSHGQLWTPLLENDELVVELLVPAGRRDDVDLVLGAVNSGYRPFIEPEKAQWCEIDVVCPEGDDWRDEIDSVGVYTVNGIWKCTGTLVNNTAWDGRALFLTAHHCDIKVYTQDYSATLVVYWNFESLNCGDLGGVDVNDFPFQSGSTLLADYPATDVTLVELDEIPDPALGLTYSGWDRTDTVPDSGVCIHHPATGVKCISFENDPLFITAWSLYSSPGDGTHLMVQDWDVGTTEGGSSGAALYNSEHRIVGQLHGGWAACGNDESDWYGRLAVSWDGGGTAESRLSDHLDPRGTGMTVLDLYDAVDFPFEISGLDLWQPAGPTGGPFAPGIWNYRIVNPTGVNLSLTVDEQIDWLEVVAADTDIAAGAEGQVQLALTAAAEALSPGDHIGFVTLGEELAAAEVRFGIVLRVGGGAIFPFVVSGLDEWLPSGPAGGPFMPAGWSFTVSNVTTAGQALTVGSSVDWLEVVSAAEEIGAAGDGQVQLALTEAASQLTAGDHVATLTLTDPFGGESETHDIVLRVGGDANLQLLGVYPNPASTWAEVAYELDTAIECSIRFYDLRGRLVRDMGGAQGLRGVNRRAWDGRTDSGARAPAGAYVCVIEGGGREQKRAITLVR